MTKYKEMIIKMPRVGRLPQLVLNGKWLDELKFTTGTTVYVFYQDSCLTLSTTPIARNCKCVLNVTSKQVLRKPRTQLVVDYWLLRKYDIHVHSRVGLTLETGKIQIQKINRFMVAN